MQYPVDTGDNKGGPRLGEGRLNLRLWEAELKDATFKKLGT